MQSGLRPCRPAQSWLEISHYGKDDSTPVVLLVEDEFEVRWPVAEYLRAIDYSVIEATSAADAMTVFMSGVRIDLAFMDFKLPGGLNGLMLAKWLEANRPATPVLLTSGLSMTLYGFGSDNLRRFIPKPYELSEVAAHIKGMLLMPSRARQTRREISAAVLSPRPSMSIAARRGAGCGTRSPPVLVIHEKRQTTMNDAKLRIAHTPLDAGEKINTHSVSFAAALAHKELPSLQNVDSKDPQRIRRGEVGGTSALAQHPSWLRAPHHKFGSTNTVSI